MDRANETDQQDVFTTETAGLPEVIRPGVTRLRDGDRLDLRIGPVLKHLDGAELRMLAYNGSVPGPTMKVPQVTMTAPERKNISTSASSGPRMASRRPPGRAYQSASMGAQCLDGNTLYRATNAATRSSTSCPGRTVACSARQMVWQFSVQKSSEGEPVSERS